LNFIRQIASKMNTGQERSRPRTSRMNRQVKQFLKLFIAVIITIHLMIGGVLLVSWLTGRKHASGSVVLPAAEKHQE
jgi:hypothetical protein